MPVTYFVVVFGYIDFLVSHFVFRKNFRQNKRPVSFTLPICQVRIRMCISSGIFVKIQGDSSFGLLSNRIISVQSETVVSM